MIEETLKKTIEAEKAEILNERKRKKLRELPNVRAETGPENESKKKTRKNASLFQDQNFLTQQEDPIKVDTTSVPKFANLLVKILREQNLKL